MRSCRCGHGGGSFSWNFFGFTCSRDYKFSSDGCRPFIAGGSCRPFIVAVMLGFGVDLQFQEPVAVEEVCRDRSKGIVLARQRRIEVVDPPVIFTSRKITDVKLRVSGDHHGPRAVALFGEEIHQKPLHSVGGGRANVYSVASARIKLVPFSRGGPLQDAGLASKGKEMTKWK